MGFNIQGFGHKVMTGFGYALGIAVAKWICSFIPLSGFNLRF